MRLQNSILLCAMGATLLLTGCKTDDEPVWDTPDTPVTPDQPDTPDQSSATYKDIRLNELNGNGDKYIELFNTASQSVDISGMQLRKDGDKVVYVAPAGTIIAAKSILLLLANQTDYATGFTSGLSAKKSVLIELLGAEGDLVDEFRNPSQSKGDKWGENDPKYNGDTANKAYGRQPDGTGSWYMLTATQGESNATAKAGEAIVW